MRGNAESRRPGQGKRPAPNDDEHYPRATDDDGPGELFAAALRRDTPPEDADDQAAQVLAMLRLGPCTGDDFYKAGIGRGASRICDLRKSGHEITTEMVTRTKANGRPCRVALYRLAE